MAARKKQPSAPTDGTFWRTTYTGPGSATGGTPMRIGLRDLSVQRLAQCSDWFGEAYGIPNEFIRRLMINEAKATMCAVWIGLQKAGRPVEDPRHLDFNFDEHFVALEDPQPPAKEKSGPPTEAETTDSDGTS